MSPTRAAQDDHAWLSLGPASELVGVDPDTLRRWADEGKVEAFTTPGGHRRFARASLLRVRRSGARDRATLSGLGVTPDRLNAKYRRTYLRPLPGQPDARSVVGDDDRAIFREEGRRLIETLVHFVDADAGARRDAAFAEATAIVRSHAARLAAVSASLTDGVALFVAARQPFLAEVGSLARRRSLDPGQLTRLYEEATVVLDRLLLEFIDGYRNQT